MSSVVANTLREIFPAAPPAAHDVHLSTGASHHEEEEAAHPQPSPTSGAGLRLKIEWFRLVGFEMSQKV